VFGSIPSDTVVARFLGRLTTTSSGALGGRGDAALGAGCSGGLEDPTNTVVAIKSSSSLSLPESIIFWVGAARGGGTLVCVCDWVGAALRFSVTKKGYS
jgi:hypothetical protein